MPEAVHPSLHALSTPVAAVDGSGLIVDCNPAFSRWLGVSTRRLQGLPLAELDVESGRLADLLARLPDTGDTLRVHRARRLSAPRSAS